MDIWARDSRNHPVDSGNAELPPGLRGRDPSQPPAVLPTNQPINHLCGLDSPTHSPTQWVIHNKRSGHPWWPGSKGPFTLAHAHGKMATRFWSLSIPLGRKWRVNPLRQIQNKNKTVNKQLLRYLLSYFLDVTNTTYLKKSKNREEVEDETIHRKERAPQGPARSLRHQETRSILAFRTAKKRINRNLLNVVCPFSKCVIASLLNMVYP